MNEQQLREALRGVADAPGRPDEAAAWERITDGIARGTATDARRRWLLGGAGVAVAGAAAALVLVVGTGDDQEAIDVGPAAESTTTAAPAPSVTTSTTPGSTTSTTTVDDVFARPPEVLGPLPSRPVAVAVIAPEGFTRLDLHDAETGALVVRGLRWTAFGFSDLSVVGETVYFTEEGGDSSNVLSIPWDGSAEATPPPGFPAPDAETTRDATLSPDGTTFAFVEQGVTRMIGRVGLVDVESGERRYLEWADDEADDWLVQGQIADLAWSPDGDRLVFVSSYEGSDVRVLDADAGSLSESRSVATDALDPAWTDPGGLVAIRWCCYPEHEERGALMRISVDAAGTGTSVGDDDDLVGVSVADGWIALVSEDGTLQAGQQTAAALGPIATEGQVTAAGL